MSTVMPGDLLNLAARLHARRSRVMEHERLDPVCRLSSISDLARSIRLDESIRDAADLQRRLVQDLIREISDCLTRLRGRGAALVAWMLTRFQVENLKALLRGLLARTSLDTQRRHLALLPRGLEVDVDALGTAATLQAFVERMPRGVFRTALAGAVTALGETTEPFFYEAVLDRAYFEELLRRADALPEGDRSGIRPMIGQEVDIFHLQIVVRGRFQRGLQPDTLLPLHVAGSGLSADRFTTMLHAPDLAEVADLAVRRVIDILPVSAALPAGGRTVDPAALDALACNRFLRLANAAFRRGHMSLGAVAGYIGIRRMEVANLITVSEGIRLGVPGDPIRARLLPRHVEGGGRV